MRFFVRLLCFFFFASILVFLHCYAPEIGRINLLIGDWTFSAGLYIIGVFLLAVLFVLSIVKFISRFFSVLFSRDKEAELSESIDNIARLIQLNDKDFSKLVNKLYVSDKFDVIKKSLMTQKKYENCKNLSLTGNKQIDIKILKARLQDYISQKDVANSLKLAREIIKDYCELVPNVQEEILQTALFAKRENLDFSFDPRKYKYNLSPKFIAKYLFSIDSLDLENANSLDEKLKLIEKIIKKHDDIAESYKLLLDFIKENKIEKYDDRRIVGIIKKSFETFPNRNLAYDLIRLNKLDQFEIAQEITKNVDDENVEKLWFLLIVSLKSGFSAKAQEIVGKLESKENINEILGFYYKNKPEEIINLNLKTS